MNFINSNLLFFPFPQNYSCIFHKKCRIYISILHFHLSQKKFPPSAPHLLFFIFSTNIPSASLRPIHSGSRASDHLSEGRRLLCGPFGRDRGDCPTVPASRKCSHSDTFFASRFLRTHPPYPAKCQTFQKYVLLAFFVRIANHTRAAITRTMTAKIGMVIETT